MFSFLKDKLKSAISKISKKVEEEEPNEEIEVESPKKKEKEEGPEKEKPNQEAKTKKKIDKKKTRGEVQALVEELPEKEDIKTIEEKIIPTDEITEEIKEEPKEEKKGFFSKLKDKFTHKEEIKEEAKVEEKKEPEEKKGFFGIIKEKITTTKISEDKFEELFNELELALLENNVAFEVVEKIKEDLKKSIIDKPIKRGQVEDEIRNSLKESIEDLFLVPNIDLIKMIKEKKEKPFVICFVGVNGVGKTSTIAKITKLCQKNKLSVVLGAGDSFRKGSIEQLEEWGRRLGVKVVKHQYGADPAAICFDTIAMAKSHNIDVVLLDTAGRQHSNADLVREMQKIIKVSKPNLKIFVGESLTGNDCIDQSKKFDEAIGIDGVILTKADVDEKGGTMISISYIIKKPILYLGVGQSPEDLKDFDKENITSQLNL